MLGQRAKRKHYWLGGYRYSGQWGFVSPTTGNQTPSAARTAHLVLTDGTNSITVVIPVVLGANNGSDSGQAQRRRNRPLVRRAALVVHD